MPILPRNTTGSITPQGTYGGASSLFQKDTRTTPTGQYTMNAMGGRSYQQYSPREQAVAANAAMQRGQAMAGQTGQVMGPQYDVPYGDYNSGSSYGGGAGGSGGGGRGGGYPSGGYQSPGGDAIVTSAGEGGGNINLSREAYEQQQAQRLRAKLANEAFEKISGKMGEGGPTVEYGGGGQADAARAATFARAKEQAGMNANAALKSIQDVMSRRGVSGSTIEGSAIGEAVAGGGRDISNVITQQMEDELENTRHVSDTTYQGKIAQRGQDMGAKQALFSILAGLY